MRIGHEHYIYKVKTKSMESMKLRQVSDDFDRARRKARFSRMGARVRSRQYCLLSSDEVRALVGAGNEHHVGFQSVSVDRIVGTEEGHRDFTHDFLPCNSALRAGWQQIDLAFYEDAILPPVQLYEIGGVYFVRKGTLLISVARTRKRSFIDADITQLETDVALEPGMDIEEIRALSDGMGGGVRATVGEVSVAMAGFAKVGPLKAGHRNAINAAWTRT